MRGQHLVPALASCRVQPARYLYTHPSHRSAHSATRLRGGMELPKTPKTRCNNVISSTARAAPTSHTYNIKALTSFVPRRQLRGAFALLAAAHQGCFLSHLDISHLIAFLFSFPFLIVLISTIVGRCKTGVPTIYPRPAAQLYHRHHYHPPPVLLLAQDHAPLRDNR
ncbi:hypothetical protein F4811DRAFT_453296 [Daldinia bambusicola]|nr:hypothetical protein F4811DRAFT_453296 [Daldinia bambusicola]